MERFLSGNEAIAQGAWEAGCFGGFGYPGTPSTETLEYFSTLPDVYAEWAPNEKVALETAIGCSMAGRRTLATMKHVGVNVAADPLMTLSYTGCNGGLVILAADDPGMHSSQNEQDSRNYARFARMPMFEPSSAQEAREMTKAAFELSERYGCACFIRSTVRISHAKSSVQIQDRTESEPRPYSKDIPHWVMMPAMAMRRRPILEQRTRDLIDWVNSDDCPWNVVEKGDNKQGFICSGAVYQYVKEAFPDVSVLKLGISWPLPDKKIAQFFDDIEQVYVVEEADNYFERSIRSFGLKPATFVKPLPVQGELSPALIQKSLGLSPADGLPAQNDLPPRPPALCPGCPHRLAFMELRRMKATVTGDIGCYTLGAVAPLSAIDSVVCMGASISMAHGFTLATKDDDKPVFAVIGDSTFAHSGITSLLNTVYNGGGANVVILDNRTTGMTGGQGNPCNGITLQGRQTRELDLKKFLGGMGIEDVVEANAHDLLEIRSALKGACSRPEEISVVIVKAPCVVEYKVRGGVRAVDEAHCRKCGQCRTMGCPAIGSYADGVAHIDTSLCVGCGQCDQVCPFDVIGPRD